LNRIKIERPEFYEQLEAEQKKRKKQAEQQK
jgi:sRNA-binding carbon storage regulator CsrA